VPRTLYARKALADIRAVRHWLRQPGAGAASRARWQAIRTSILRLKHNPCLYPVQQHPGVRELPCQGGYRVFYEFQPDTSRNDTAGDIRILRVFGPGQSRDRL
jgi:plasmid stabilization system protein ParE